MAHHTTYSNILFALLSQQLNSFRSYQVFGVVLVGPCHSNRRLPGNPSNDRSLVGATLVPQRRQVDIKRPLSSTTARLVAQM